MPIPAPKVVMDALTEVSVTVNDVGQSGFQLSFTVEQQVAAAYACFLLTGGSPISILRVVIVVIVSGTPHVIMDGVVTNHQIQPGQRRRPFDAVDHRRRSDRADGQDRFQRLSVSGDAGGGAGGAAAVEVCVSRIVPLIIPSVLIDVPIPTTRIPAQKGTDLAYINDLATKVGYVFYLDPGPAPGTNMAYWGPQIKVGTPQPALNINMDAHTNVESLTFTFNNN